MTTTLRPGTRYRFGYGEARTPVEATITGPATVELEDVGPYPSGLAMQRRLVAVYPVSDAIVAGDPVGAASIYAEEVHDPEELLP